MRLNLFTKVSLILVSSIILVVTPILFVSYKSILNYSEKTSMEMLKARSLSVENRLGLFEENIKSLLFQAKQRQDLIDALEKEDVSELGVILNNLMDNSLADLIAITNADGKAILRTHTDKKNDDISHMFAVKSALKGEPLTMGLEKGTVARYSVRGATPVYKGEKIIGVIIIDIRVDKSELVDALKEELGTEVTFFSGDERVSSTLLDKDGQRMVGTKLNDPVIEKAVLKDNKQFTNNLINLGGLPYSVIYTPMKNSAGEISGMLFLGLPLSAQQAMLQGLMRNTIIIGLVMAILLGITGIIFARMQISKPLAKITGIIEDLLDGRAEMSYRLDTSKDDELAQLSHQVNRLTNNIGVYQNLVRGIAQPILVVNKNYDIVLSNAEIAKIAGVRTFEELRGVNINKALHTDIFGKNGCPIKRAMETEASVLSDVFTLDVGKQTKSYRALCDVVRDHTGAIYGYALVATDVTDMVEQETEIRSQMERIQSINTQVRELSALVNDAASDLRTQAGGIQDVANRQNSLMGETSISVQQMAETVMDVARNAAGASEQAEAGQAKASDGEQIVQKALEAINTVLELANALSQSLEELDGQAESIGMVMRVISDIADQTNLLALNAAIEAARAGDAGRGFAVVADEVRVLAERTTEATQEVRQAVENIQTGASQNLRNMEDVHQAVMDATAMSQESSTALSEIVLLVSDTASQIVSIAAAAEEQSTASEQIARAVEEVSNLAQDTASQTEKSSEAVESIAKYARDLRRVVEE